MAHDIGTRLRQVREANALSQRARQEIVRAHGQLAGAALSSFRYHSLKDRVCDSIGPYGPGR